MTVRSKEDETSKGKKLQSLQECQRCVQRQEFENWSVWDWKTPKPVRFKEPSQEKLEIPKMFHTDTSSIDNS